MGMCEHKCLNCGKQFKDYFETTKFCSRVCHDYFRNINSKCKTISCQVCGKSFKQKKPKQQYCSVKCRVSSTKNREICVCDCCGKTFERIVSEVNKNKRHFCSTKCRQNGMWWSDEDTDIIRQYYGKISYKEMNKLFSTPKTIGAISNRAKYIGVTVQRDWTNEEIKILKDNYSIIPMKDVKQLLPNRSSSAILGQARKNNLLSYFYLTTNYSDEEEEYLRSNYLLKSNEEISKTLHRSPYGIEQHLRSMGLHRPKQTENYVNINKYIRARLQSWKDLYKKNNNYTCVITGKKSNIVVHHIRSLNLILSEAIENIQFPIYEYFSEYSTEQLDNLFNEYMNLQDYYNQYVCVNEDVHKHFHCIYGYGDNTKEQWDDFIKNNYN